MDSSGNIGTAGAIDAIKPALTSGVSVRRFRWGAPTGKDESQQHGDQASEAHRVVIACPRCSQNLRNPDRNEELKETCSQCRHRSSTASGDAPCGVPDKSMSAPGPLWYPTCSAKRPAGSSTTWSPATQPLAAARDSGARCHPRISWPNCSSRPVMPGHSGRPGTRRRRPGLKTTVTHFSRPADRSPGFGQRGSGTTPSRPGCSRPWPRSRKPIAWSGFPSS
jgi:hypothetical protein